MPYKGKKKTNCQNGEEEQRRSVNWQPGEINMLLDEIRLQRHLLLSSFANDVTNKQKEEAWENIGQRITAAFGISQRTGLKCREKWTTLKMALTSKKKHAMGTGGGPPKPVPEFYDAVAAILGEKTAIIGGLPVSGTQTFLAKKKAITDSIIPATVEDNADHQSNTKLTTQSTSSVSGIGASLQHSRTFPGCLNQDHHQLFTYEVPSKHSIVHLEIPKTTFGRLSPALAESAAAKKRATLHMSYENSSPHTSAQKISTGCGVSAISDFEAIEGEAQLTVDSNTMLRSGSAATKKRKILNTSYENSSPHTSAQIISTSCGVSAISDFEATEGEAQLTIDSDTTLTSGFTVPEGLQNLSTLMSTPSGSAGTKRKKPTAQRRSNGQEGIESDPLFRKYLQTTVDKNISYIAANKLAMAYTKLKHKKVLLQIKLLEMQVKENGLSVNGSEVNCLEE